MKGINYMNEILEKYQNIIISTLIIIVIILDIIIMTLVINKKECYLDSNLNNNVMENENNEIKNDNIIEYINIDIKGAVKKPGVYKIENDKIINDAIKMAGGLTKNATTDNINLSKKLNNEMVIYIFNKNELKKIKSNLVNKETNNISSSNQINVNEIPSMNIASPEIYVQDITSSSNNNVFDESNTLNEENNKKNDLININTASKDELLSLTGIGESKAEAIIKYRENNKFKSVEDIKNVSGIGDSLFDKIKNNITI